MLKHILLVLETVTGLFSKQFVGMVPLILLTNNELFMFLSSTVVLNHFAPHAGWTVPGLSACQILPVGPIQCMDRSGGLQVNYTKKRGCPAPDLAA